ncbi:MAG: PAS domain S-box protein [Desulfobacterales bacterium]|nr:PAS domain S-box protein [Desulfobacterales bacterium]
MPGKPAREDPEKKIRDLEKELNAFKQWKKSARDEKAKYRTLAEELSDVVLTISPRARLLYVSPAIKKFTGYGPEKTLGNHISKYFVNPRELDRTLDMVKKIVADKKPASAEFLFKAGKRECFYVEVNANPIVEGDKVKSIQCVMRDITKRKKAEDALREREGKYRNLMRLSPAPVVIIQNEQCMMTSLAFADLFGYTREDLDKGLRFFALVQERDKEALRRRMAQRFAGEKVPKHFSLDLVAKDGRATPCETSSAIINYKGEPAELMIIHDISERKKMEGALRRSEERYRQFFENNLAGVYISRTDGHLISCNPAFAHMIGFSTVEEAKGAELQSFYLDVASRAVFLDLLRKEKRLEGYETRMRRIGGEPLCVIENAVGVFDERGDLVEINGYLFDVTEHKELKDQLRHSQKMESIGTLTSGVAHNFKNILAGISMDSQLLRLLHEDDEMLQKIAKRTESSVERGSRLITELMKFSRKEARTLQTLNLVEVIQETYHLVSKSFNKMIDIQLDAPATLLIMGDHVGLNQVFMNLCTNARDAMPRGGILHIQAWKEKGKARVNISDTGRGMDKDTREKCFDPFFTTKELGKGTGLGLSTTYGIVKDHVGNIYVYSEIDKGTTFKVFFPLAISDDQREEVETFDIIKGRGEKILVIDDEMEMLNSIILLLEKSNYSVFTAHDGRQGFEEYKTLWPDAVLLDRNMPKMDGAACAEHIMAFDPDARILMISGYEETGLEAIDEETRSMIKGYISKPLNIGELSQMLDGIFKEKREGKPQIAH